MNEKANLYIKHITSAYANLNNAMNYLEVVEPDRLGLDPKAVDTVLMGIEDQILAVRDIHNIAMENLDASSMGETA
ncbi:MAG: hypothetical protein E6058_08435 [Cutibacterium avidum]|nr:hypothetical protein [Cutibacterium avidum]